MSLSAGDKLGPFEILAPLGAGGIWIRVSTEPLLPALATRVAKRLAEMYEADRASADWRHLGRLSSFTNRKPQRRPADGLAPCCMNRLRIRERYPAPDWSIADRWVGQP